MNVKYPKKLKVYNDNILVFSFPNKKELGLTFFQFQESYESRNPELKSKNFTLAKFIEETMTDDGVITYFNDWDGYNIPYWILKTTDPLSEREWELRNIVDAYVKENKCAYYYVIGVLEDGDDETLRHELAHAFSDTVDTEHTGKEFKDNFKTLLSKAQSLGLYNPSTPLVYDYCQQS